MPRSMITIFFFFFFVLTGEASANSSLLVIIDSSNSMWGQVSGVTKMETAKSVLGEIISDLPEDSSLGLMAYGHRSKSDCGDIELLAPLQPAASSNFMARLKRLTPKGKTPIADSLAASAAAFASDSAGNSVVLISDGVETCGGDPCAAATQLRSAGVDVRVHVVGFDLTEEERGALACIAENGGGQYFNAESVDGFRQAVTAATQLTQAPAVEPEPEPEPEPSGPKRTLLWSETFDGFDLMPPWAIENPDPDSYIVEDGALLTLSSNNPAFNLDDAPNRLARDEDLPRGDWDVTAHFRSEMSTIRDVMLLGLRKDAENYMVARFYSETQVHNGCGLSLSLLKVSRGEETNVKNVVPYMSGYPACGGPQWMDLQAAMSGDGVLLTLSKRDRQYFAKVEIPGYPNASGNPLTVQTNTLTSLRPPGRLALGAGLWQPANGEALVYWDSIEAYEVTE